MFSRSSMTETKNDGKKNAYNKKLHNKSRLNEQKKAGNPESKYATWHNQRRRAHNHNYTGYTTVQPQQRPTTTATAALFRILFNGFACGAREAEPSPMPWLIREVR